MRLTQDEILACGKFSWGYTIENNKRYYTLRNKTDCMLFWHNFIKNVFVNYFKSQSIVTNIPNFNQEESVCIDEYGELTLPPLLEIAVSNAKFQKIGMYSFTLNVSMLLVFIIFTIVTIFVGVFHTRFSTKTINML